MWNNDVEHNRANMNNAKWWIGVANLHLIIALTFIISIDAKYVNAYVNALHRFPIVEATVNWWQNGLLGILIR